MIRYRTIASACLLLLLVSLLYVALSPRSVESPNEHAHVQSDSRISAPIRDQEKAQAAAATNRTRATPFADPQTTLWDELQSGPYWWVLDTHWQRAVDGNADSMVIAYAIFSTCRMYRQRFTGRSLAEVQAEYAANNDPALNALNEAIHSHCGPLYEDWGSYRGWRDLLDRAADESHPYAIIVRAQSMLTDEATFDEGIELLKSGVQSKDIGALVEMVSIHIAAGSDLEYSYGWLLAACQYGMDCSADGAFMQNTCGPFSTSCGVHDSVQDYLVREIGQHGYEQAVRNSQKFVSAIDTDQLDDLDLERRLEPYKN